MKKRYVILYFFDVTTKWLSLSVDDRKAFRDRCFGPIFHRHRERVRPRILDAWAFGGRSTDIVLFETGDVGAYYELMDELRNTELFSGGFIERVDSVVTVEDDFLE